MDKKNVPQENYVSDTEKLREVKTVQDHKSVKNYFVQDPRLLIRKGMEKKLRHIKKQITWPKRTKKKFDRKNT